MATFIRGFLIESYDTERRTLTVWSEFSDSEMELSNRATRARRVST